MHLAVEKMKLKLSLEWVVRHPLRKDGDSVEGTGDCGDFITWQRDTDLEVLCGGDE